MFVSLVESKCWVAGQVAQWIKVLAVPPEDLSPCPRTHTGQLTSTCSPRFRGSDTSSSVGTALKWCTDRDTSAENISLNKRWDHEASLELLVGLHSIEGHKDEQHLSVWWQFLFFFPYRSKEEYKQGCFPSFCTWVGLFSFLELAWLPSAIWMGPWSSIARFYPAIMQSQLCTV